jgi:ADP-ribose pyrophosphatase YjhB (NUDIX family)
MDFRRNHSMLKPILITSLCLLSSSAPALAEGVLTAQETRWLVAAAPVLAYSQGLKLPIDIVVQPQRAGPGDVPLAMGFDGKRCKLVLTMRGNPQAEAILEKVPPAERGLLIEAMTAHEVGHCWRYVQGVWHALPAGFVETGAEPSDGGQPLAAARALRESRREEGFADLVALAWIARTHPHKYRQVHVWIASVRTGQPTALAAHDTRAWVSLARDARAFGHAATPFEDVQTVWAKGLLIAD